LWFENTSRKTGDVTDVAACSCLPRSASTNQLRPVRIDYQCQDDTNRSFQLACPGGVCSSRELPSCTDSLEWEEEEVGFEKCQELSFKGESVLCGINGTKETAKRLRIWGGIVEEVVTTPCNDCAALEWTAWAPCAHETSRQSIDGMLCRRRGNTYMGFEGVEIGLLQPVTATQSSTHNPFSASKCIDGDTEGPDDGHGVDMCHTNFYDRTPWIAIDYGKTVTVQRVEIFNRVACCGDRTKNVDVRISDELPTSGSQMFSGGTLFGHFPGPATNGEHIVISGQREMSGRYLIVQINNGESATPLNLKEVRAFGRP